MPRKEKFEEYNLKTKITTIRIPDLENLDKEKELRKRINDFVLDFLNLKANTNTIDTSILKKMIKPFSEYGIELDLKDIEINRIKELYEMI